MPSLIEELQRDALDQNVSMTELLQKCLLVATKLGISEFADWARLELDGYKTQELPEHRVIYGELQVFNPSHGYQGFRIEPHNFAEMVSKIQVNQSISEIEHDLRQANKASNEGFHISFPPDNEKILINSMESPMQPSLFVGLAKLRNIVDAVRKVVLEWSLKLERDGILGEGMSFSREEKHKAQSVTYNIKNYIHGNVEHSQVQVESIDSIQIGSFQEFDVSGLIDIINALKQSLNQLGIVGEEKAELVSEIGTLESQAESPKLKTSIIKESLESVRKILEGAAGTLVARGLLDQIGKLFSP